MSDGPKNILYLVVIEYDNYEFGLRLQGRDYKLDLIFKIGNEFQAINIFSLSVADVSEVINIMSENTEQKNTTILTHIILQYIKSVNLGITNTISTE